MGRRPQSAAVKQRRGTYRPDKTRHKNAPELPPGWPAPPEDFTEKELAAWRRFQEMLEKTEVVSEADLAVLVALCRAQVRYDKATAELERDGLTFKTVNRSGEEMIRAHPAVRIAENAERAVRQFLCELGLTPASRPKVPKNPAADKDDSGWE